LLVLVSVCVSVQREFRTSCDELHGLTDRAYSLIGYFIIIYSFDKRFGDHNPDMTHHAK